MPCYIEDGPFNGPIFMCGQLGPHCAAQGCLASADYQCDYPVGKRGRLCNLPLCPSHAYEVKENIHYCPEHLVLWEKLRHSDRFMQQLELDFPTNP